MNRMDSVHQVVSVESLRSFIRLDKLVNRYDGCELVSVFHKGTIVMCRSDGFLQLLLCSYVLLCLYLLMNRNNSRGRF